jgi:hypothetical protein
MREPPGPCTSLSRSAPHGLAAASDLDHLGDDGKCDLLGRNGADAQPCRRPDPRQPLGINAARGECLADGSGFAVGIHEGDIAGTQARVPFAEAGSSAMPRSMLYR